MNAEDRDRVLATLLEQLTERLQDGEQTELEELAARHPDFSDELHELWTAMQVADAIAAHTVGQMAGDQADDNSRESRDELFQLPCCFGDYELLEEVGRGGMGVVYRARQTNPERVVAVKLMLRGELAGEADHRRFRTECESAARLDHPNVLPLYEVGTHDGQPFFSMKYVDGETLEQRISSGPLPGREAAKLLVPIARAIQYAHAQGVLHRDLKPANILIDRQGRPFVTDFGLAKQFTGSESLTQTGAISGTPSYMAPEQAASGRAPLGPACDIYSLGTLLYAMLTGRPPFQGPSPVDTVLMLLEQDPFPPRLLNAKIDRELEMVTLRCLQKPPDLRYARAADLADDLESFLGGEPIMARSGRLTHVVARWFRETHHATVLENWGLLWMWHSVVLLVLCLLTNGLQWLQIQSPWPFVALWGGGLAVWAPTFWTLRRRSGPVTFVERQIAHVWAASVIAAVMLFLVEYLLDLPVLTLSPVLGLTSGMVFLVKAGVLSGSFYIHATALFLTAIVMAVLQYHHVPIGITIFGIVSAATFFFPGLKYYRQRRESDKRQVADA